MSPVGPEIALVGAARSGTSFLAAALAEHPEVDAGAVKEPNYFSREFARGEQWYDDLYLPRRPGRLRLDASMSYTFRHFPDALARLAETSPEALVVYVVRHPLDRLVSHFQLHRDYFHNESAATLGEALTSGNGDVYTGAGDYSHWLAEISAHFPTEQVLVVPFPAVTRDDSALRVLARLAGLDDAPLGLARAKAATHQNHVVRFRHPAFKWLRRAVRRRGWYPAVRRLVGTRNLRRLRGAMTRATPKDSLGEALATCSPEQLARLQESYERSRGAVAAQLATQDDRLGLDWAALWATETPPLEPPVPVDDLGENRAGDDG